MKIRCNHCGQYKDEAEFSWRWKAMGKRQKACKVCKAGQDRASHQKHKASRVEKTVQTRKNKTNEAREYVWSYLASTGCKVCGERNPALLEFHHVTGSKKAAISTLVSQGYSIQTIQAEIAKCEVLCVTHHRLKTYKDRGWYRG